MQSSSRPWRSSSPPTAAAEPASCARSRQRPWPFSAPPTCCCRRVSQERQPGTPSSTTGAQEKYAPRDDILVLPADLVAETADGAVLAAGLKSQNAQSLGDDHLLLLVIWGRDTLEDLQPLESGSTAGGLVGDHATDGLVEDAGRGAEVERSCGRQSQHPGR